MSFAIILSSLAIICRRFPLLVAELIIRIADQIYRLFLDNKIEEDITFLLMCGYKNVGLPYHHCLANKDTAFAIEFYTTTRRIGAGSFSGWRMRVRCLPDLYIECNFGDIKETDPFILRQKLVDKIQQEIAFLQLTLQQGII